MIGLSRPIIHHSFAANQGATGPDSLGDADLTVQIPQLVRITGLQDIDFGTYSGGGNMVEDRNLCVYTNLDSGEYRVEASGSGADDVFELARDGGGAILPYTVAWQSLPAGSHISLNPNEATAFDSANTSSQDCSVGENSANMRITLLSTDLLNIPVGSYAGVLSITILSKAE